MPKDSSGKETGWISPHAFQTGALSADERGRQATQDGYIILRMLDKSISDKLALIGALGKRLKALEKTTDKTINAKLALIGGLEERLGALEKAAEEIPAKEEADVP